MWATAGICIPLPTIPATPKLPAIKQIATDKDYLIAMLYFFLRSSRKLVQWEGIILVLISMVRYYIDFIVRALNFF